MSYYDGSTNGIILTTINAKVDKKEKVILTRLEIDRGTGQVLSVSTSYNSSPYLILIYIVPKKT